MGGGRPSSKTRRKATRLFLLQREQSAEGLKRGISEIRGRMSSPPGGEVCRSRASEDKLTQLRFRSLITPKTIASAEKNQAPGGYFC